MLLRGTKPWSLKATLHNCYSNPWSLKARLHNCYSNQLRCKRGQSAVNQHKFPMTIHGMYITNSTSCPKHYRVHWKHTDGFLGCGIFLLRSSLTRAASNVCCSFSFDVCFSSNCKHDQEAFTAPEKQACISLFIRLVYEQWQAAYKHITELIYIM